MDDAALRDLAIKEIIREINDAQKKEKQGSLLTQVNPLGRPNKRFLDRTVNSVLQYNKRQHEREQRNSTKKLRELNERRTRRKLSGRHRRSYSSSSDSNQEVHSSQRSKTKRSSNQKTKETRRRRIIRISSSSSSIDSSCKNNHRSKIKSKQSDHIDLEEVHQPEDLVKYNDQYDASNFAAAYGFNAYAQMNYFYSTMLEMAKQGYISKGHLEQPIVKSKSKPQNKPKEEDVITIDLTIEKPMSTKKKRKRKRSISSHISVNSSTSSSSSLDISVTSSLSELSSI